ncbi:MULTISPECIES: extracellular solute-binding protein [Streptomyces]|uniref:Extracellular solute-binding protein n=1 Tax=Streptomyces rhizosphaericola TaxID=2564098 RepID=A0ABY2PKD8_9ACTN|nr:MULTISPECIES: extracellular solute-binding protein [Streptomyces]ARI53122.1 ABC transporter substrate-binding protein [Streptomyces sp. S8]MYT96764.1 extracellular solute-binding protein [Streptomyces sp. SID8350]NGO84804.1 extracellular solute-binding protein [Streptomyces sp. 196(2019)]TGZ11556.1 extracellular solute-binding protein [Streptomyces rhizosphaericola]SCK59194.1 carbohydrate ABC transporter substrate-binding protein, CUT1 family [Streptomyces sp. AmelKG-D3]
MGEAVQRRFTVLTAVVAALGMTATLSGCGEDSGTGDVTLKLVAADYGTSAANSSEKYWSGLVAGFEKANPGIKVEVNVLSWKDVDRKVAEMVKEGKAPDIAQIGAYADFAKADKLYSVDQMVSIRTQANFLPSLTDAGKVDGTLYGLPFVASTRLLFYNENLFDQAGLKAPKTWDDIQSGAAALKAQGVKYPFALPLGQEEAQAETMMWLLSNSGGYVDDVGLYDIDSAQNIATFTWLRDNLVGKGLTGPVAPGELDRAKAFEAFTKGEVGMLNGHPTLMEEAEAKGVKVGMVPLPGAEGPTKGSMGVADWMMGFKQNGNRQAIGKFFDYAYSDENVLAFADEYDLLPVTGSASAEMETDNKHVKLREFLAALPNSQLPPFGKTSWATVSESVKKNIGEAVAPGGSPERVLGSIASEATRAESAE